MDVVIVFLQTVFYPIKITYLDKQIWLTNKNIMGIIMQR